MALKIVFEIALLLVGMGCLLMASHGDPIPFKGALLSPWSMAAVGLIFIVWAVISLRDISNAKSDDPPKVDDEELTADLARQEQLYFEEHGETPAETTARLLKEKQERKECKSRKS